jgi:hypothetical protein
MCIGKERAYSASKGGSEGIKGFSGAQILISP